MKNQVQVFSILAAVTLFFLYLMPSWYLYFGGGWISVIVYHVITKINENRAEY